MHISLGDLHARQQEIGHAKQPASGTDSESDSTAKQPDAVRAEALNILSDLTRLSLNKTDSTDRLVDSTVPRTDPAGKVP